MDNASSVISDKISNTSLSPVAANHTSISLSKNQRNQLEKRIKFIESEIPTLEASAARLTADMSRPDTAADYAKLASVTARLSDSEATIKSLYEEWEAAADTLNRHS
jgi:chromosome segregation ATPase